MYHHVKCWLSIDLDSHDDADILVVGLDVPDLNGNDLWMRSVARSTWQVALSALKGVRKVRNKSEKARTTSVRGGVAGLPELALDMLLVRSHVASRCNSSLW